MIQNSRTFNWNPIGTYCIMSTQRQAVLCSNPIFEIRGGQNLKKQRAYIIRKSKCSTDFKRNDFLKKNEAYPLGALRSLKFAYRKLRISLFVELAV